MEPKYYQQRCVPTTHPPPEAAAPFTTCNGLPDGPAALPARLAVLWGCDSPQPGVQVCLLYETEVAEAEMGLRSGRQDVLQLVGGDRVQGHPQSLAVCSLVISVSHIVPKWPNVMGYNHLTRTVLM